MTLIVNQNIMIVQWKNRQAIYWYVLPSALLKQ